MDQAGDRSRVPVQLRQGTARRRAGRHATAGTTAQDPARFELCTDQSLTTRLALRGSTARKRVPLRRYTARGERGSLGHGPDAASIGTAGATGASAPAAPSTGGPSTSTDPDRSRPARGGRRWRTRPTIGDDRTAHGRHVGVDVHPAGGPAPPGRRGARPGQAIRRRRMGSLRAHALDRPPPLRPGVPLLVPGGVGRPGEDPPARRGTADRQPCRCHPLGRPGHHARHRRGAGPTGLRHGRLLLQDHPGGGDHVVTDGGRARPPRQRLPAPARPAAVGPGVPRGHQGDVEDLLGPVPPPPFRAGRVRGDRHEGRACPSSPSPSSAPRSRCPSSSG